MPLRRPGRPLTAVRVGTWARVRERPSQGACRTPDAPTGESGSAAASTVLPGPAGGPFAPCAGRAAHGRKFLPHVGLVRAAFAACPARDRAAMDRLLADDHVFTGPQDDHIGRTAFFGKCFPTADRLRYRWSSTPWPSTARGCTSATRTS